jgi:5'-nucleotidase
VSEVQKVPVFKLQALGFNARYGWLQEACGKNRLQMRVAQPPRRSKFIALFSHLTDPDPHCMRILLSNDDGYLAPGIQAMRKALEPLGEVTTVAPDRNKSGASHSLTLSHPIHVRDHGDRVWSVEGTPTDCVNIALSGLLDERPDMVVSGINDGPNMGDDVLYSGTVAAAIEGRHLGEPAIAVSMASFEPQHLASAARAVVDIVVHLREVPLPADTILNINVPDVPYEQMKGFQATRLGTRHPSENATRMISPRGETLFWIGAAGDIWDAGEGTDFGATEAGWVSVTPLTTDLTRQDGIAPVSDWLTRLNNSASGAAT